MWHRRWCPEPPHSIPMQRGRARHPAPSWHSPDLGRTAIMSSVRPAVRMSSLNLCRSWGLAPWSLAAARHPKRGLVSAGGPGSEPHAGGPATAGQRWDPREGQRQSHKGAGWTHQAPHGCPGLAAKGHMPLGRGDPPAWGGTGLLAGVGGTLQGGGGALVQIANNWGYFYSFTPK